MGLRVLYWGDSPTVSTGFGVVSKNLLNRFVKNGYEVIVLGINHMGEPYNPRLYPYPIYPCRQGSFEEIFGIRQFWNLYESLQPDIIFLLNDPWIIESLMNHKPKEMTAKIIAYYPTDAGPMKKSWVDMFNTFDAQVCYSKYAEKVLIESNGGIRPDNLFQIYHGVDTKTFYPIPTVQTRQQLGLPPESFIVGMVARNQPRKRFDLLMEAFSRFAKDKPEAKLYFHTAANDIGFDILGMERQYKLGKKFVITENITPIRGVPENQLNIIYNTFDVNTLISLGDGFGLPVAESMAVGCPQLVSGHSCLQELVEGGNAGLTVKTAAWLMNSGGFNTWGGVSSVDDLVEKLEILYNSKELRIKYSENGYNYIHQDQFTWDYCFNQFNKIIRDTFHLIERSPNVIAA